MISAELATALIIESASLGVAGESLFLGPVRAGPGIADNSTFVLEYGGDPVRRNFAAGRDIRYPLVTVQHTNSDYQDGVHSASILWNLLERNSYNSGSQKLFSLLCEQSSPIYSGYARDELYSWSINLRISDLRAVDVASDQPNVLPPLLYDPNTNTISLPEASRTQDGYLSASDYARFSDTVSYAILFNSQGTLPAGSFLTLGQSPSNVTSYPILFDAEIVFSETGSTEILVNGNPLSGSTVTSGDELSCRTTVSQQNPQSVLHLKRI